jgi:sugar/nucleoside kinase (ribokinase family)
MRKITPLEPIDYLVVGHITRDLTEQGPRIGGTVAYAGLTARALGLRVGIVTSWGEDVPAGPLGEIPVSNLSVDNSTTFENLNTPEGRVQIIHSVASRLDLHLIPETWRSAPIVHLGPVAQEVEPGLVRYFPASLICLTPQGWLRAWNGDGAVYPTEWPEAPFLLSQAGAVVISVEDVEGDESRIDEMASYCRVLAVTEAAEGARLYWHGDVRRFRRTAIKELDPTGAGDIFAAAFFTRLHSTRDPWEAARFATYLSSFSVTRIGLASIPTAEEIEESMVEVF